MMRVLLTLLLRLATAKRPAVRRRELLAESGPSDDPIEDTGLLEKSLSSSTVYERSRQWHRESAEKKKTVSCLVLGYVTPWHRGGYDFSIRFRAKFTHVSPVWYILRRPKVEGKDAKEWSLVGGHEYNQTWIDAVRQPVGMQAPEGSCNVYEAGICPAFRGKAIKIVPRVVVEVDEAQDHLDLVKSPHAVIKAIVEEVESKGYDGIVLEVWMTWAFMNGIANDAFRGAAFAFIQSLSQSLRTLEPLGQSGQSRELILAVPPILPSAPSRPRIDPVHMAQLSPFVDAWSLMTYDFSAGSGAQPNAPVQWLEANMQLLLEEGGSNIRPEQALLGLNFYGYDYLMQRTPSAMTADAYLQILAKHQPILEWKEDFGEHSMQYTEANKKHVAYFPTPLSLQQKLNLIAQKGMSISIWELGQGMERWFDLL